MRVRYTPEAHSDLATILQYIDERSARGGNNVKRAIQKTIELIGEFPDGGRAVGSGRIRALPAGRYRYLIYWVVEREEVWLLHIRDTRRRVWRAK